MRTAQKLRYPRPQEPLYCEVEETITIPYDMGVMSFLEQYGRKGYVLATATCNCVLNQIAERRQALLGRSEIPLGVSKYTFADFDAYPDAQYYARKMAAGELMVDDAGVDKPGLLLCGPYGTGKTTIGSLIWLARQPLLPGSVWGKYVTIMKRLQDPYTEGYTGPSQNAIIEALSICPLLMIDELGNAREAEQGIQVSRDRSELILRILDYRAMQKKPTIITSNLNLDQWYTHFDPAMVSRIRGLCHAVWMDGTDHRTGEAQR